MNKKQNKSELQMKRLTTAFRLKRWLYATLLIPIIIFFCNIPIIYNTIFIGAKVNGNMVEATERVPFNIKGIQVGDFEKDMDAFTTSDYESKRGEQITKRKIGGIIGVVLSIVCWFLSIHKFLIPLDKLNNKRLVLFIIFLLFALILEFLAIELLIQPLYMKTIISI